MMDDFKNIILSNKGAVETFEALSNGASIRVVLNDGRDMLVSKKLGSVDVRYFNVFSDHPDFTVKIPADVVNTIFFADTQNAHEFIVNSANILTEKPNIERISLEAHVGFIKLTMLGYLKIIPMGGSQLFKILSGFGIGSIAEIKRKLSKFTNK